MMDRLLSIIFFYVIALLSLRFVSSSPSFSLCFHESNMFMYDIELKCPTYRTPPLEVDGKFLEGMWTSRHGNSYISVLFYASWCPFSQAFRSKFDTMSSMFPQIEHLAVEQSYALPTVFSRYGIHSLPSVLVLNQTSRVRYHGPKDLSLLVQFYEKTTGLKPVQYIAEAEWIDMGNNHNLMTMLWNGSSMKYFVKTEPYLAFSLLFLCLRMMVIFPRVLSRMKSICASYVPYLNLGIFGERRQLFARGLQMIDVRRIWTKLRLCKTRNFHERAKNARVWASSLASVSLGESSSPRSSS